MNKILLLQFAFILIAVSAAAQNKEEKKLILASIEQQDQKLATFYKKSQADSIAGLFSPNCHLVREFNSIIEGRENVLALYNKDFKAGIKYVSCKFDVVENKVYDDLVLEIGVNTLEYTKGPDKALYRNSYNYMFVWKKSKEGKYQIRSAMWNLLKNPCN